MKAEFYLGNPEIVMEKEEDGALLFNPENGEVKILNLTGAFVFEHLDGKTSIEEICKKMGEEFEIEDLARVRFDVGELLKELVSNNLVVINEK